MFGASSATAQSAPDLKSVTIYAVGSSQYGWEMQPSGTTQGDHGGAQLRIAIFENGIGKPPQIAWMNGVQLPSPYLTQRVCAASGGYTTSCQSGQSVIGMIRYFNADGYQSGTFKYRTISVNTNKVFDVSIVIQ